MAEDCIELRMVVGRYAVTVRGENPKVVVKQIAFFSELPEKCPVCGALVRLTYREPPQPARGNQPEYGRPARTQPPGDYRRR